MKVVSSVVSGGETGFLSLQACQEEIIILGRGGQEGRDRVGQSYLTPCGVRLPKTFAGEDVLDLP